MVKDEVNETIPGYSDEHERALPAQSTPRVSDTAPLTPDEVRNQVFTVGRLREGYNLSEVDAFLARVESTLTNLYRENAELRRRRSIDWREARPEARGGLPPQPRHSAAATVPGWQEQAASATIIAAARQEAESILAEARQQAEALNYEALEQALALQQQTHAPCQAELERQATVMDAAITDYRRQLTQRLAAHIEQLSGLLSDHDASAAGRPTPPAASATPGRATI